MEVKISKKHEKLELALQLIKAFIELLKLLVAIFK